MNLEPEETARKPKHIELDDELCRLELVIAQFEDFCLRLQGEGQPDGNPKDAKRPVPSFCDILNTSANRISTATTRILELQNRLESTLF